jgi:hypothetical protein
MTCPHAQKVEYLTLGRICRLDRQTCFNFDVDALVATCPVKMKEEK